MQKSLEGRRILVVEDEFLIAMEVEDILRALGAEVVGPFGRVEPALGAVQKEVLDGAVLDVRLDGETSEQVAADLVSRGVPVLLTTGYEAEQLPPALRHLPRFASPSTKGICGICLSRLIDSRLTEMALGGHFGWKGWRQVERSCQLGWRCKAKRNGLFCRCHWESLALSPPAYTSRREGPVNSEGCPSIFSPGPLGGGCFARASPDHAKNLADPPPGVNPFWCLSRKFALSTISVDTARALAGRSAFILWSTVDEAQHRHCG